MQLYANNMALDMVVRHYDEEVERLREEKERLRRKLKDRSLALRSERVSEI